jgi:hypothetical protein
MAALFDSWVVSTSREIYMLRCLLVSLQVEKFCLVEQKDGRMSVSLVTKKVDDYKESTLYLCVDLFSWLRKQTSHLVATTALVPASLVEPFFPFGSSK